MTKKVLSQHCEHSHIPKKYDLVICASGYESRASFQTQFLGLDERAQYKIALCFDESSRNSARKKNDSFFRRAGFNLVSVSGDQGDSIHTILSALDLSVELEEINVFVDYSCMTRVWYASILNHFYYSDINRVNVYFGYSYAIFKPPSKIQTRNIHVNPIEGFSSFFIPNKPTALLIGLGYEKDRAFGLTEYFDAETFLFYNDASFGSDFSNEVETINKDLINSVSTNNIFRYPIKDMDFTEILLNQLCRQLNENFKIVIAPSGPKPFTLLSFIVALKLQGVDVWRISPGSTGENINRIPTGDISVYKVSFVGSNN